VTPPPHLLFPSPFPGLDHFSSNPPPATFLPHVESSPGNSATDLLPLLLHFSACPRPIFSFSFSFGVFSLDKDCAKCCSATPLFLAPPFSLGPPPFTPYFPLSLMSVSPHLHTSPPPAVAGQVYDRKILPLPFKEPFFPLFLSDNCATFPPHQNLIPLSGSRRNNIVGLW